MQPIFGFESRFHICDTIFAGFRVDTWIFVADMQLSVAEMELFLLYLQN